MNRHHPYGGYDQGPPRRRSASPPYRGRGGRGGPPPGRGRGRGAPPPPPPPFAIEPAYGSYGGYNGGGSSGYDYPQASDYGPPPGPGSLGVHPPSQMMGGPSANEQSYPPYPGAGPYEDYSYPPAPGGYPRGASYDERDGRTYREDYMGRPEPYDDRGPPPPDYRRPGYEDERGTGYEERGRGGGIGPGRGRGRRVRDDKVHDSIIEERINRERPCRTLFIRNIKYESSSEDMRQKFASYGEIKTFFDLIKNRGMVFVTYYDLRAAELAREQLQGFEVSGRPIDVHYSLPRDFEVSQRCDREKNQGTVRLTLVDSPTRAILDDNEVRRKFQQFGDVKSVRHVANRPDQRLVEMFDSRACATAHDRLRDQSLQDGVMVMEFEWDVPEQPLPPGSAPPHSPSRYDDPLYRNGPEADRGVPPPRDRGHPPGRGRGGGPPMNGRDEWDRRGPPPPPPIDPRDRDRDYRERRGSYMSPPPDDRAYARDPRDRVRERERTDPRMRSPRDYNRDGGSREASAGRVPPPRSRDPNVDEFGREKQPNRPEFDEQRERERDFPRGANYPPPSAAYSTSTSTSALPPVAAPPATDDRLEQAMKVQQLLAALKPTTATPATAMASAVPPFSAAPVPPPVSYYSAPTAPAPLPAAPTPYGAYSSMSLPGTTGFPPFPPNSLSQSPAAALAPAPTANGAPPNSAAVGMQNLLALLAQSQQR